MAGKTDYPAWLIAMTRAALPGARRVVLKRERPDPQTVTYSLTSFDDNDKALPDGRDYDIFKSVMAPLEKLCSCEEKISTVELDLDENSLNFL